MRNAGGPLARRSRSFWPTRSLEPGLKAIAEKARTEWRRMFVCSQGLSSGASPGTVTGDAAQKASEKTSKVL